MFKHIILCIKYNVVHLGFIEYILYTIIIQMYNIYSRKFHVMTILYRATSSKYSESHFSIFCIENME